MRDIQNLYFIPFAKKALTLYSQIELKQRSLRWCQEWCKDLFFVLFSTLNRQRISSNLFS